MKSVRVLKANVKLTCSLFFEGLYIRWYTCFFYSERVQDKKCSTANSIPLAVYFEKIILNEKTSQIHFYVTCQLTFIIL